MNLFSAAERLAAMDRQKIYLDTTRCLYALDKFTECSACISTCPVDAAISGVPPTKIIDDNCIHCLACLPVCPTGAIQGSDALKGLLNCVPRLPAGGVDLVCEKNTSALFAYPDSGTIIRIRGCLAGLGPDALVSMIAADVSPLRLRVDDCNDCPIGKLEEQIRNQVQAARQLLEAWGKENSILCCKAPDVDIANSVPAWDADNPPLSRRDLFRLGTRQGSLALARAINAEGENKDQKASPRARRRLLEAVKHLPENRKPAAKPLEGLQLGWISVTSDCTACGVCARACPTGGIDFYRDDENTFRLIFHPGACTACGVCTHSCGVGAIELQGTPTFDQVFTKDETILIEGELKRCQQCNTWIPVSRTSRLCPICEFRRKNPFGSSLPPGFRSGKLPVKRNQDK